MKSFFENALEKYKNLSTEGVNPLDNLKEILVF
jgi:hypothetical protein